MPMWRTRSGCCARATSGQAATKPPRNVMNSRRRIEPPEEKVVQPSTLRPGRDCEMANNRPQMLIRPDVHQETHASQQEKLFDHLVCLREQRGWHVKPKRLGGPEIDDQVHPCRKLQG